MTEKLTTETGQPWANNEHSQTAGARGPVLMQDYNLLEKLAHFDRERIQNGSFMLRGPEQKVFLNLKTTWGNILRQTYLMVSVRKLP